MNQKILNFLISAAGKAICCFVVCGLLFLISFAFLGLEMPMYVPITMAIVVAGLLTIKEYRKTFK